MDTTQNTQSAEQTQQDLDVVSAAPQLVESFDLYQRAINFVGRYEDWTAWESFANDLNGIIDEEKLYRFLDPRYSAYHEAFFAAITRCFEHPLCNAPASKNADERLTFEWHEWNADLLSDIKQYPGTMRDAHNALSMIASARLMKTTTWFLTDDLVTLARDLRIDIGDGLDATIAAVCEHIVTAYRNFHTPRAAAPVVSIEITNA